VLAPAITSLLLNTTNSVMPIFGMAGNRAQSRGVGSSDRRCQFGVDFVIWKSGSRHLAGLLIASPPATGATRQMSAEHQRCSASSFSPIGVERDGPLRPASRTAGLYETVQSSRLHFAAKFMHSKG
jgi:hypothetical protein